MGSEALALDALETEDQRLWLAQLFDELPVALDVQRPSEWAEQKRYLPPSNTRLPGFYSFSLTPYLREIVDCLSVDSPIREVSVMKGVQLGLTVGVLENAIGYFIDHVKTAPMMMVTADSELAKLRLESFITPMLQHSGLEHLIKSADEKNARKTGKTDKKIEWIGGGYLVPFGAQNANKLRSIPIQILLRDEVDGWPDTVGKDGDPMKLSFDRTATYEGSRKVLDISTPLIKGLSKIAQRFERGDQRHYFVRCLKCNFAQILRWRHNNNETGEVSGMTWQTEGGRLVADSVRYLCQECGHPHSNEDKNRLLSPDHGAEWRPTAEPADPCHRSYHVSALYSPPTMQTWAACVHKWLDAWDTEHNRPRDLGQLQVFYNNVLGEPFELRGEKIRFELVSAHRRNYHYGTIPNKMAVQYCGGPVLLLTCAVDVHKESLAVAVFGWCRDRRAVLVDYWRFEGNTEQLDDPNTWGRLRKLIEDQEYVADDGKKYRIQLTLIDSGYRADDVYRFSAEYAAGVFPVKGRDAPPKSASLKEFSEFTTPNGIRAYGITVDFYKDRWSAALRRGWDGLGLQPQGHFNAPVDASDPQLKELTVEVKRERIEKSTGKRLGFEWHRPSGANNELWDCLIYNNAALDLIAWNMCRGELGLDFVNWVAFFDLVQQQKLFFTE
jgi:phage terminase large subunit GpA-like protein